MVSAAEAETQVGVAQVAEAQVATLAQQKSYEVLRAPFAGTVTARFADPGALVQAATGAQTGALPLVTIATPEKLRVYIYVPQRDAGFVQGRRPGRGHHARSRRREDRRARGAALGRARSEDAHDAGRGRSRQQGRRASWPGSFVTVALSFATPPEIVVPVEALVLQGHNASVFVLDGDTVHARAVTVSDNDGSVVRLARGLQRRRVGGAESR